MRNKWFPYHVARYLTFEERKAIKRGEMEVLRDYSFEIAAQSANSQTQGASKESLDAAWKKYMGGDTAAAASKRQGEAAAEVKMIEARSRASQMPFWSSY